MECRLVSQKMRLERDQENPKTWNSEKRDQENPKTWNSANRGQENPKT